ncbi:MAG: aminotransferase class V-fold PLP-dependent enzyme [Bacteroidota bacterium]
MYSVENRPSPKLVDPLKASVDFREAFNADILQEATSVAIKKLKENIANKHPRGLNLLAPDKLMTFVKAFSEKHSKSSEKLDRNLLEEIIDLYTATGIPVYSTGYMGRQFSGVIPITGLTDLLTSMMSQPSSFYESAQLPSMVEKVIAKEFGDLLGWNPDSYDMVTTSGGSLANITAILTARNTKVPDFTNFKKLKKSIPAIAVSADVHYSIKRAVGILGIGEKQLIPLPINDAGQICMEQAESTLAEAEHKGYNVFCLVATAGTTVLGAIDPLEKLAELCQRKNCWFHIDGAHGGSFLVSDKLRNRLKGIELADSFALDAHKTMFLPAACTLLFYKDIASPKKTFYKEASYIFENESNNFDGGEKSFECTKRPMIMNLWIPWVLYGKEVFAQKLEALCNLATQAYTELLNTSDFECIHEPQTNILCFRYQPEDMLLEEDFDLQIAIRNKIKEEGKFFISKVEVQGKTALRVVFMNHEIQIDHFKNLLAEIRNIGQNILTHNNIPQPITA